MSQILPNIKTAKIIYPKTTTKQIDEYVEKRKAEAKEYCKEELKTLDKIPDPDLVHPIFGLIIFLFILITVPLDITFMAKGIITDVNIYTSFLIIIAFPIIMLIIGSIISNVLEDKKQNAVIQLKNKINEFLGYDAGSNLDSAYIYFGENNSYYCLYEIIEKLDELKEKLKNGEEYKFDEFRNHQLVFARYISDAYKLSEFTINVYSEERELLIKSLKTDNTLDFSFIDRFYNYFLGDTTNE